jgi:hypothetical protein
LADGHRIVEEKVMQKYYGRWIHARVDGEVVKTDIDTFTPLYLASDVDSRIAELAAKWEAEIAVAYNEHSQGQRAGLEQAAAELRSLMVRGSHD